MKLGLLTAICEGMTFEEVVDFAAENPKTTYACINYWKAYCPKEIGERAICIFSTKFGV